MAIVVGLVQVVLVAVVGQVEIVGATWILGRDCVDFFYTRDYVVTHTCATNFDFRAVHAVGYLTV